ncbi:MAG: Signal peptidase-like protein [Rhodothermaceae bacterium]|nr:Signal peptidase-like protein [Rhodothermaceae bacterium]
MGCGSCSSGGGCGGAGCGKRGGCSSKRKGTSACPSMHAYDWLSDFGISNAPVVYDLIEVAFKGGRKGFYTNNALDVQTGDFVVVEADRGGRDFGTVHLVGEMVRIRVRSKDLGDNTKFPRVIRRADLDDINRWEANKEKETETFLIGRRSIDKMNLPMKLVDTEWQFDHKKVTFYFTADHRVDFRELVRDLARRFKTRVELRQIGARDEAARIGGIGSCGRELCCSTWLQDFKPVSTQAAKVQNLPLNPVRLSGQCGRLKCCLNYELEQYMTALATIPSIDTPVYTERGKGIVRKIDIFKEKVWILYEDKVWEEMSFEEATRRRSPAKPS